MYLLTHRAGWGRNIWRGISHGTVRVDTEGETLILQVDGDVITEKHVIQGGSNKTIIRYGRDKRVYVEGRLTEAIPYKVGTSEAKAQSYYRTRIVTIKEPLFIDSGPKGTRHMAWRGECLIREWFTYSNKRVAYTRSRKSRGPFRVVYPNGKPMVECSSYTFNTPYYGGSLIQKYIKDTLSGTNAHVDSTGRGEFHAWDTAGKECARGQYENRQKVGRWLTHKGEEYYLRGVQVSQTLFETPPAQLDPKEVLALPNAQLRASLLSQIGMQKVVERYQGKVIHQTDDGKMLMEVVTPKNDGGLDTVLRILKVVCPSTKTEYYLRVPPTVADCEAARLWTLGVEQATATPVSIPRPPIELLMET